MEKLRARLRRLLTGPVMDATERAGFGADIDAAQSVDDLAVISGRLMNVGARELGKVADGIEPIDRVEAARIRADASSWRVPEVEQDSQVTP